MGLQEYLHELQDDLRRQEQEFFNGDSTASFYPERVFAERVMQWMAEEGMTGEPEYCHYEAQIGNGLVRLSGYALSGDETEDEAPEQLDLFVTLYDTGSHLASISSADIRKAAEQAYRFVRLSETGKVNPDPVHPVSALVELIRRHGRSLECVRVHVLSNGQRASRSKFAPMDDNGRRVLLDIMDIERIYNQFGGGGNRSEVLLTFPVPLPCVPIPDEEAGYDCVLTAIPGESLRALYEEHGSRVLEGNVRSFLGDRVKVNKGIVETLQSSPQNFIAYNNGVVVIVDEVGYAQADAGVAGISWLRGVQIVNGGQTTASLYFSRKKHAGIDLSKVRVAAKIIQLGDGDEQARQEFTASISKYANSQNSIKTSDLSANHPWHVELERLAEQQYCPDGQTRWYYERSAGSYQVMLKREGGTQARLKQLKQQIPASHRLTKTDLIKYLTTWEQKPWRASLGGQKNHDAFMTDIEVRAMPDTAEYKRLVALAILFISAQKRIRKRFKAYQGNITCYTISMLARQFGERLALEQIWQKQAISAELGEQLEIWADEVRHLLNDSAGGRMISEWAKKPGCWEYMQVHPLSQPSHKIAEWK